MDPRLRSAAVAAAPKIVAALLTKDARALDRELRRLENRCGYVVAKRALDAAVHSPSALKHALAIAAPHLVRAADASRRSHHATVACLSFVDALVGQGVKHAARVQLERVDVSEAVRQAFVDAAPGALAAAAKGDAHRARDVAAHLAANLVQAKTAPLIQESSTLAGNLRNAGLQSAPSAALAAIRFTKSDGAKAVCEFVGRAGVVSVDHVADKFVRGNYEDIFAARRTVKGFVKELVLQQWLEKREFVVPVARSLPLMVQAGTSVPEPHLAVAASLLAATPVWQQAWTHVVYTTPRAAHQFSVPLPPDLRQAFIPHYLRTMDACLSLEKRFEEKGFEVERITGENQLIRENFAGQVFAKGRVVAKFPDAQLVVVGPTGERETINVEYVTKSYTPQMIREKAAAFSGPTVWAVDSHATAAKVAANAGTSADILLV